jgi:LysR family transcriptional regulator, hypochlorite-specific transcription factor HypT
MRTPNLSWLEDFLVLSASGNFSRAAEERHMTQPAFSRRIRALEDWLGVALFDRSTQPAQLTETGTWFADVAKDMLARSARLPAQAKAVSEGSAMALRIASTHALSLTFMPVWLRGMEQKLTLGPVSLVSDVMPRCEAMLEQQQVQFVLCHNHAKVPCTLAELNFPRHVVGRDQLIPVSVTNRQGRAKHELLALKGSAGLLGYSTESGIGRILKVLKGAEMEALHLKSVVTAQTASVLRSMVLDGRGVAWLPLSLVADDLTQGVLAQAAPEDWHIELDVCLFRGVQPLGQAAEDFWRGVIKTKRRPIRQGH